jgi:hypothetical protein
MSMVFENFKFCRKAGADFSQKCEGGDFGKSALLCADMRFKNF